MPKALTIKKNDDRFPSWLNFEALRTEGLSHIAELSGDIWTDHNLHDPGITILEVLCYALTDLGYRTRLDVKELLALDKKHEQKEDNFFTAEEILTINPLTILDYRKMLIDISGVRNAWLEPAGEQEVPLYVNCREEKLQYNPTGVQNVECTVEDENGKPLLNEDGEVVKEVKTIPETQVKLNGLYKVYLDLEPIRPEDLAENKCSTNRSSVDDILNEVRDKLNAHRNLCEDFMDVVVLRDEQIGVCGDIELKPDADPVTTLENIYEAIQDFLSPRLNYFSLQEMLEKGKSTVEIFEGRPLTTDYSHGFIDPDELEAMELRTELHTSDFYKAIMSAEGVRAVKRLFLLNYIGGVPQTTGEEWCLHLTANHRPLFDPELSVFNFTKGLLRVKNDKGLAIRRFRKQLSNFQKAKLADTDLDLPIPAGRFRNDLCDYYSIQHEFPLVYGIGEGGLPQSVSNLRKAQALQLKGYLMFYDQLLADYLAQLANIRDLFSMSRDQDRDESGRRTYFSNALDNVPQIEKLVRFFQDESGNSSYDQEETVAEVITPYGSLVERDIAMDQLIRDFQDLKVEVVAEVENSQFYFIINNRNRQPVLRSVDTFDSEETAIQTGKSLIFLGILKSSFRVVNYQEQHEYTFEFIYKPIDYLNYLANITESQDQYYQRRERFLDHLLGRFGEEFTEYVLLMFALNEERQDPAEIIDDKANFLSQYDEISRNRGRAFNYADQQEIWDTNNVSGLERRVAGLMGLDDWQRRDLNNFEVVLRDEQFIFEYTNDEGVVLFTSAEAYPCESEAWLAYYEFLELATNKKFYQTFHCSEDHVYGFRLLGFSGKPLANHPATYATAVCRDDRMQCLCDYFSEKDGLRIKVEERGDGFYYIINDKSNNPLVESLEPFEAPYLAWEAAYLIRNLGKDPDNYGAFDVDGFGFVLSGKRIVARHSKIFASGGERDFEKAALINKTAQLLREPQGLLVKTKEVVVGSNPVRYAFQIKDKDGFLLFESPEELMEELYDSKIQAERAGCLLKRLASYAKYYQDVLIDGNNAGYTFELSGEKLVARYPGSLPNPDERNSQQELVQAYFGCILPRPDGISLKLVPSKHGYYFFLNNDEDDSEVYFQSSKAYATEAEACAAWHNFITQIRQFTIENPQNEEGEGYDNQDDPLKDRFTFVFVGKDQAGETSVLAQHPEIFTNEADRDTKKAEIITSITSKKLNYHLYQTPTLFNWKLTNEEGDPVVKSYHQFKNQAQTADAWFEFLTAAIDAEKYVNDTENGLHYFYVVKEPGLPLAVSPGYNNIGDRDIAKSEAIALIAERGDLSEFIHFDERTFGFELQDDEGLPLLFGTRLFPNRQTTLDQYHQFLPFARTKDNYQIQEVKGYCHFHLVVKDQCGDVVAKAPNPFPTFEEAEQWRDQIIMYLDNYIPPFATQQPEGAFGFDLKDDTGRIQLTSFEYFKSKGQALNGFWTMIQMASKPDHLCLSDKPEKYTFFLVDDGQRKLAVHPSVYTEAGPRNEQLELLRSFLSGYQPWIQALCEPGHFRFDILDTSGKLYLKGEQQYTTRAAAQCAFYTFLDIADSPENYIKKREEEGCCYCLEIQETPEMGDSILWATHPGCYPEETFEVVKGKILHYIKTNKDNRSIKFLPGTWHYELCWESCGGYFDGEVCQSHCEVLLSELAEHETEEAAKKSFLAFLEAFYEACKLAEENNGEGTSIDDQLDDVDDPFTFGYEMPEGNLVAIHPYPFINDEERQEKKEKAEAYLKWYLAKSYCEEPLAVRTRWRKCGNCQSEEAMGVMSGFRLARENDAIARHPQTYQSNRKRDRVLRDLFEQAKCGELSYPGICIKGDFVRQIGEKYYYEVRDKAKKGLVLWRSYKGYNSGGEAQAAFEANWWTIVKLAANLDYYKIPSDLAESVCLVNENERFVFIPETYENEAAQKAAVDIRWNHARFYPIKEVGGNQFNFCLVDQVEAKKIWESTAYYSSIEETFLAFDKFLNLLLYQGNYRKTDNCQASIYSFELHEVLLESDETYIDCVPANDWAIHPQEFERVTDCDTVLETLYQKAICDKFRYSEVCFDRGNEDDQVDCIIRVDEGEGLIFFQVVDAADTSVILWEKDFEWTGNEETGTSEDTVLRHFRDNWFNIIYYSANPANYQLPAAPDEYITITDETGVALARIPGSIPEEEWQQAIELRLAFARHFPIIPYADDLVSGLYQFRLYNAETGQNDWISADVFSNRPDAFAAFAEFREKIKDKRFYQQSKNENNCNCQIALTEILDEDYENAMVECGNNYQISTDCLESWAKIKDFLIYAPHDYAYYPYVDYDNGCGLSFRIVSNVYRVANHPGQYHTPGERELARDWLYAYARCQKGVTSFGSGTCQRGGRYFYQLKSDLKTLWMSYESFDTDEDALAAFEEDKYSIIENAREISYYKLILAENNSYQVALLNDDDNIIAVIPGTFEADDWNQAIERRMRHARAYPYQRVGSRYGFLCYSFEDFYLNVTEETENNCPPLEAGQINVDLPGMIIWESTFTYATPEEAECAFNAFFNLLGNKNNYQRTKDSDCGPFTLEITHPNQVLATHPQTYFRESDLEDAIQKTKDYINGEGFHLLEHILLRPKVGLYAESITIQFSTLVEKFGEEMETGRFLLVNKTYDDLTKALEKKDSLIGRMQTNLQSLIEGCNFPEIVGSEVAEAACIKHIRSEFGDKGTRLGGINRKNFKTFIDAIGLEELIDFSDEVGSIQRVKAKIARMIITFDKNDPGNGAEMVKPNEIDCIPICPDCCNIVTLPGDPLEEDCEEVTCENIATIGTPANTSLETYIPGADPFSFWATIVLPYWPRRFQNPDFRQFFEDTLRREIPSHIALRICWLDPKQMELFEKNYRTWLISLSGQMACNLHPAQDTLVKQLFALSTVYPPGQLQRSICGDAGDTGNVILLNQSQLA